MPYDGSGASLAIVLLPLPLTLAAAWIDLRRRIIPDLVNLALLVLGVGLALWRDPSPATLAAVLGEAGLAFLLLWGVRRLYALWRGRIGLGLGDVKFIAAATAWTGLAGLPVLVLTASLGALCAVAIAGMLGRTIGRTTRLPFAPFLGLGLHVALLVGQRIVL